MKSLGFTSELFAMQSEMWFYNNVNTNNYSFRELIASEKRNDGKPVDDMLLVDELKESLGRYPVGKHLVVLHTKGSHYLYSQRYPRSYARYQPECMGVDEFCSKQQLINAFDNSVLYTDSFIANVIDQMRDKKRWYSMLPIMVNLSVITLTSMVLRVKWHLRNNSECH